MSNSREFDVVLYGATGFTGRQTVQYFARHAPPGLRWAVAGRNLAKLEALDSGVPLIAADSSDQVALDRMAARTRVLLTTTGPFAIYGSGVVEACVRAKTHYCDITGETAWVRDMIDRHHAKAAAEGTRLIPFSGFDSVPSDLGAMLVARNLGGNASTIQAFFQMRGGLNGGTLASAQHMAESGGAGRMRDPFLLNNDQSAKPPANRPLHAIEQDPTRGEFHQGDGAMTCWSAPFVMSAINTRVVRRSCEIRGEDFAYQEYLKASGLVAAAAIAVGGAILSAGLRFAPFRSLLRMAGPRPGAGPSEATMDGGWFRCELFGSAADGRKVRALIADKGDPGNRVTVKCLCETALALALDGDELPPDRAGFLTPSTGVGDVLVNRLRNRGMELSVT